MGWSRLVTAWRHLSGPFWNPSDAEAGVGAFLATFAPMSRSFSISRNTLLALICIGSLFMLSDVRAQEMRSQDIRSRSQEDAIGRLRASVMAADAATLASQAAPTVEIILFGEGASYSRGQATLILKQFFEENPPQDFRIERRTRTSTAAFTEGSMRVRGSERIVTWMVRYAVQNGSWRIRELHVEESDD